MSAIAFVFLGEQYGKERTQRLSQLGDVQSFLNPVHQVAGVTRTAAIRREMKHGFHKIAPVIIW